MYWCRGNCSLRDFTAIVGKLSVTGPEGAQEFDCIRGDPCKLERVDGIGLRTGDAVRVLLACGAHDTIPGMPSNGSAVAETDGVYRFVGNMQASVGMYRVCWESSAASHAVGGDGEGGDRSLQVEVGILIVHGPRRERGIGNAGRRQVAGGNERASAHATVPHVLDARRSWLCRYGCGEEACR